MPDINSQNANGTLGRYYDQDTLATARDENAEPVGIGGFYFFATISDNTELKSSSPDIALEKGSVISDTIFLSPPIITMSGVVGDVYINERSASSTQTVAPQSRGQADFYGQERPNAAAPGIIDIEQNSSTKIDEINKNLSQSEVSKYFGETGGTTLQERFVDFMTNLYQSKQLVEIDTRYQVYTNMHLASINWTTDANSKAISFKITAKKIRVAEVNFRQLDSTAQQYARNPSAGLNGQTEGETDKGNTQGQPTERSLLSAIGGE